MNKEEIDDWLRLFSNNNQSFMSKDGKKITLFKVFQELKELQQENQSLKKENKILRENAEHNDKVVDKANWENLKLKEVIDKSIEYIESNDIEVLKYHDIPSETTSYEIVTVNLLKILKGGEND